jgi:hypothetical protein
MLLAPLNKSDEVEVTENRDGTGTFIARIRILRFRLRMSVSECVVVVFVASERIWTLRFVVETSTDRRIENKWILSLELGEHSPAVGVDAHLSIEGTTSPPLDSRDFDGPQALLDISFGSTTSDLWPGREDAITVRLDDGANGPHFLTESSVLVDTDGTLCAQLNAKLVRPTLPALVSDTPSTLSPPRPLEPHRPPVNPKPNKQPEEPTEKIFVTLRRGGL